MSISPRRRGPAWERLGRSVAIPAGLDGRERFRASLHAWARVLPEGYAFTGLTAAAVQKLRLPPVPESVPLFVAVPERPSRCRHRQLAVTRHTVPVSAVVYDGLRIATVQETLLACARELGLLDVLVLLDSALHLGHCTRAQVEAAAQSGRRGAPRLRQALAVADHRSESPWETLLRMLHVACGVAVQPQAEIRAEDGRFLARADLLVTGTQTLQEYDGAVHLEPRQYRRDRRRDSDLAKAGYVRNGWTAHHLAFAVIGQKWRDEHR